MLECTYVRTYVHSSLISTILITVIKAMIGSKLTLPGLDLLVSMAYN